MLNDNNSSFLTLDHELSGSGLLRIGRFKFRAKTDNLPQDWWVASTAFPLIAATIGPLANVLSISALVTKWRANLPDNGQLPLGSDENGVGIPDPEWETILNAISLGCGFAGNFFLLLNFMRRVRYIVALPLTIILWYLSTGILIGIIIAMEVYVPPVRPGQTYSQGFWSAVMAACLYLLGSIVLMVNMLGYFLGHYPQHFELDDNQRTLILQTMMFFHMASWRGRNFAAGMSQEKIVKHHARRQQQQTIGRTVTNEKEIRDRLGLPPRSNTKRRSVVGNTPEASASGIQRRSSIPSGVEGRWPDAHFKYSLGHDAKFQKRAHNKSSNVRNLQRREKLILLREEKDRFDAMREIQSNVRKFKQYYALSMSVIAFAILWCGGATVFWRAEKREQDMTYFEALYFCYVSLLTIGYGDFAPKSNAGKPFFVVWSLIAIPTMTILISDMSSTVIAAINRGTFTLADWTVMPKEGVWHDFLTKHPRIHEWLSRKTKEREAKKRIRRGFDVQNPDDRQISIIDDADPNPEPNSLGQVVEEIEEPAEQTEHDLARKLALAIKHVANDLRADKPKKYSYTEWVEFTRLIRFSTHSAREVEEEEEDEGLVEWDWIGDDSPMLADVSESEWVLDRLCESLNRYTRRQGRVTRQEENRIKRLLEEEKKHLHHKAHHNMHYPAHPGPRTPSLKFRRYSAPTGGGERPTLRGGSLSGKGDQEWDDDEDDEAVKRDITLTNGAGGKGADNERSSSTINIGDESGSGKNKLPQIHRSPHEYQANNIIGTRNNEHEQ
ncbi:hypothetical protein EYC84_001865 [Monilinia fructicola]|uniref:Potassium channel domain-containing protein n=1 Tax=Monilinia fructicola TaxID=38448 RepID=A0A5M9JVK3_MONFR|nr:hypothetical protein EYC84_001865 [Monilinia fructicola]